MTDDLARHLGLPPIYPESWRNFHGQERAKRALWVVAMDAASEDLPMPNLVVAGPPGTGRKALVLLAAQSAGAAVEMASDHPGAQAALDRLAPGGLLLLADPEPGWVMELVTPGITVAVVATEPIPLRDALYVHTEPYSADEAWLVAANLAARIGVRPVLHASDIRRIAQAGAHNPGRIAAIVTAVHRLRPTVNSTEDALDLVLNDRFDEGKSA